MLDKMRVSLILLLFLTMIFTMTIVAAENDLALDDIIELALENNLDLQLAELNLEDARINYKKNELSNLRESSRLFELQSELQLIQAEENYKNIKNSVILDIIATYIDIIKRDQDIKTAEKELALEERRVDEVKAQVEVGYKGTLDLFEQETTYLSVSNRLERIKYEREQELRRLNQKIAVDVDINIRFLELNFPELWEVNQNEVLEIGFKNNALLEMRDKQLELAKSELERAKVSGTPGLDLRQKEIDVDKAILNLKQEEENLENSLKNTHFQYQQSIKNLEMAEKSLHQSRKHYNIINEQFEAGLLSRNNLLSSELQLYNAKNNLTSSIISYYTSKLQLQQEMGLDLEVEIDNG
ncbi:TolC family protein [Natronospora cellulosivora (SeqCode)]